MALIKVGRILLFLRAFNTVMLCTLWIVISGRDWFPQFPKRSFGKTFCKVMTSTWNLPSQYVSRSGQLYNHIKRSIRVRMRQLRQRSKEKKGWLNSFVYYRGEITSRSYMTSARKGLPQHQINYPVSQSYIYQTPLVHGSPATGPSTALRT